MARWIAVAMLGVCLNAGATSYYVSNAGADGNNGTSAGTAWRTLAHGECADVHRGTRSICSVEGFGGSR